MSDATREFECLAEADGATLIRSATAWYAKDHDGITVVFGALSRAEAARAYCEDKDRVGSTPEAVLEVAHSRLAKTHAVNLLLAHHELKPGDRLTIEAADAAE